MMQKDTAMKTETSQPSKKPRIMTGCFNNNNNNNSNNDDDGRFYRKINWKRRWAVTYEACYYGGYNIDGYWLCSSG